MRFLLPLLLSISGLSACRSSDTADASKDIEAFAVGASKDGLLPAIGERANKETGHLKSSLSQGTSTALGLSIPKGMVPAPGPHKVYRFEGLYPVVMVRDFIFGQVYGSKLVKEGNGYLMRRAKVKEPKGQSPGKSLLAIRIFKGRKGGATIDIWIDRKLVNKNSRRRAAMYGTKSARRTTRMTGPAKKNRNKKRKKAMESTFHVMDKVNRGELLDEDDMDSPFLN